VQIEIVGRANDARTDEEYETLGKLIADCMRAGLDLDLDLCPRFWDDSERGWLATYTSGVRLSAHDWTWLNTILGHQHAPENAHWDPGGLDVHRVCDIARRHLEAGGHEQHLMAAKEWSDMATREEFQQDLATFKDQIVSKILENLGNVEGNISALLRAVDSQSDVERNQDITRGNENVAGVVRAEAADVRAQVVSGLEEVLREMGERGELPAGLDRDALVVDVAARLTVAPKTD
jgi:hypothetical protein